MADLAQTQLARDQLRIAAEHYLRDVTGKSVREIQRWRAYLTNSGAQSRNPAKAFAQLEPFRLEINADYAVGGNPKYLRKEKGMWAEIDDPDAFFRAALGDPDEAFQMFFDANSYPSGTMENVNADFLE